MHLGQRRRVDHGQARKSPESANLDQGKPGAVQAQQDQEPLQQVQANHPEMAAELKAKFGVRPYRTDVKIEGITTHPCV